MNVISFTRGVPPEECIPDEQLAICSNEVLKKDGKNIFQYGSSLGYQPLRDFLSAQKNTKIDQIILGQGSLQLLDIIARSLINPSDEIAIEQPTYDRALNIFFRTGRKIHPIPMQENGIDVDALEERLRKNNNIRFIYVIPDFQNPSGSVMSLEKRKQLVRLARENEILIIEDAPYRFLRYQGENPSSIYDLAPEITVYLSSFSKTICPGLRVGYSILPQSVKKNIADFAEGTYINASYLNQAIVYQFVQDGFLDKHLEFIRKIYSSRLKELLGQLEKKVNSKVSYVKPQGGFFVGLHLPDSREQSTIVSRAKDVGLQLSKGSGFFMRGGEDFIRLPFCALNESEIREGVDRLAILLD